MGNILLVDDDEFYLGLLKIIFEQAGFMAYCATNGYDALQILKKRHFSVMITDFNMPEMDGHELAIMVREILPDIYIVMATGEISTDVHLLAERAGISKVINKPFSPAHILRIVRTRNLSYQAR
jgi:CheY-like chemotaxis protein